MGVSPSAATKNAIWMMALVQLLDAAKTQNPIPKDLKTVDVNESNLGQEGLVLCTIKLVNPEWVRNNNMPR